MSELHEHGHVRQRRRTAVDQRTFNPAQIVAAVIGLLLLITAGVAMARVGLDTLTGDAAVVFGVEHTLLAGLIEFGVGVLFLAAAASPWGARGGLIGLGVAAIAFGAVVTIEPDTFTSALGDAREMGRAALVIGVISVVAGIVSPTFISDRTTSAHEVDRDEGRLHDSHY